PEDDPITILTNYVVLNAISRGLTDYALRFMFVGISAKENGEDSDWKKAALGHIEATKDESKTIRECYLAAFDNLTDADRVAAFQYYKGEVEQILLRVAQRAH